jgi:nucleoside-triphosphatase
VLFKLWDYLAKTIFLTGQPGAGKTTVLLRTIERLREGNLKVGGMVGSETREGGARIGFRIADLESRKEGWLANTWQRSGPKIGRYRVCLDDLEQIGVAAVLNAVACADVVVIDEVGPMELFSPAFRSAVSEALESGKTVLGTVHYRVRDPLVVEIKSRKNTRIVEVTLNNRAELPDLIAEEIFKASREA